MKHAASFRDPSGFVFIDKGRIFRQVNLVYKNQYEMMVSSGLLKKLFSTGMLISHIESRHQPFDARSSYKILEPEKIQFISHPFEWSFHQYKDAALTMLRIQRWALDHGMVLKDASAYNIQFHKGRPLLIDTLSFEIYHEGCPWDAYKQFCQHFLAPLALMAYTDIRLGQLMKIWIDGIPLDLAASLLPAKTHFDLGLQSHIFLHAAAQKKFVNSTDSKRLKEVFLSKVGLQSLIVSLEKTVRKLIWKSDKSEWGDYYNITNYSTEAFSLKKNLVEKWLKEAKPSSVWDLGGNTGEFSRLASDKGIPTVCFDIDPVAVDLNYLHVKAKDEQFLLPLLLDLTNPSPAIGWENEERASFIGRGPVDMIFALALIHHMAISNNVPLSNLAHFFSILCKWLIIEFIPKEDSQVQILLANRKDIFDQYHQEGFENSFIEYFEIEERKLIQGTKRILFFMKRKSEI